MTRNINPDIVIIPEGFFLMGSGSENENEMPRHRVWVDDFGLGPHVDKLVGELSPGLRRALDLACVVALRPRLLLLDEPSSGLAEAEAVALDGVLRRVRDDTGATMVMVEHDLRLAFGLSDVVVVMETARVVAAGPPQTVREHPSVNAAFLGA